MPRSLLLSLSSALILVLVDLLDFWLVVLVGSGDFNGISCLASSLSSSTWSDGLGTLSRTLTMMPSHLTSVALLKNSSTVSESAEVASIFLTQVNR